MENMNLGKCCTCEQEGESVRNILMLDKKQPDENYPGGWGCVQCGLPAMGAVAVICDSCVKKKPDIKFACVGYPGQNNRIEIEKLTEVFEHDMSKHPEETLVEFDEPGGMQDVIECRNCKLITAVIEGKCANCGEEICVVCGCTTNAACSGGCYWSRPNICSQCVDEIYEGGFI